MTYYCRSTLTFLCSYRLQGDTGKQGLTKNIKEAYTSVNLSDSSAFNESDCSLQQFVSYSLLNGNYWQVATFR